MGLDPIKLWLEGHEGLFWWLAAGSAFAFVATLVAVPMLVVRIPANYFIRDERGARFWDGFNPATRILLITLKNLLGTIFVLAGVAMLVLPGQGILTILAGVMLLDFPRKYQFERWLASRGPVRRSIEWIRHRAGKERLKFHPKKPPDPK